jgi:hypothetical protein
MHAMHVCHRRSEVASVLVNEPSQTPKSRAVALVLHRRITPVFPFFVYLLLSFS